MRHVASARRISQRGPQHRPKIPLQSGANTRFAMVPIGGRAHELTIAATQTGPHGAALNVTSSTSTIHAKGGMLAQGTYSSPRLHRGLGFHLCFTLAGGLAGGPGGRLCGGLRGVLAGRLEASDVALGDSHALAIAGCTAAFYFTLGLAVAPQSSDGSLGT